MLTKRSNGQLTMGSRRTVAFVEVFLRAFRALDVDTLVAVMTQEDCEVSGDEILAALVEGGEVTLGDVAAAAKRILDMDEDDIIALLRKHGLRS